MRILTDIDFTFENCEGFTLNVDHFNKIYTSGIYRKLENSGNHVCELSYIDSFLFIIKKEADTTTEGLLDGSIFERLTMYNDISKLTLKYSNEKLEPLNIEWFPKNINRDYLDYFINNENQNQGAVFTKNGDLAIFCGAEYDMHVKYLLEQALEK